MNGVKSKKRKLARCLCIALAAAMAATPLALTANASSYFPRGGDDLRNHSVGVIGSFNGWDDDVQMYESEDEPGVYLADVEIGYVTEDMINEWVYQEESTDLYGVQFKVRLDGMWDDNWGLYEPDYVRTNNSQTNCFVEATEGEHLLIHVRFDTTKPCDEAVAEGEISSGEEDKADWYLFWPVTYKVDRLDPIDPEDPEDPEEPEDPSYPTDEDLTKPVIASTVEEMQSPHNYYNNMNKTYSYTLPGAEYVRFTFSEDTCLESEYDYLSLIDAEGNTIKTWTDREAAGISITIPGDTVRLRMTSDGSSTYYGFRITEITEGSADEDFTQLEGTVSVDSLEDMKCTAPLKSGMRKTWKYDLGKRSTYAVKFSDDTGFDVDEDGNPSNTNDYLYVCGLDEDGYVYYDEYCYGNSLAGKTLYMDCRYLCVSVISNTGAGNGFAVTSVRDIESNAASVEDLHAEYEEDLTQRIINYHTGIESGWTAITFSDDTSLSEYDYVSVNGYDYYGSETLAGKTIVVNGSDLRIRSYMTNPGSKYRIAAVKDAVYKVSSVSELKSAQPAVSDEHKIYEYTLPEDENTTDCIRATFSNDTVLEDTDCLYVNDHIFRGIDLAGKTYTFSGNTLRIRQEISSSESKGFKVVSAVPGDPNEIDSDYGDGTISNDYLKLNASFDSESGGRFSLYARDNNSDNDIRLLYSGTSRSTINIDGNCSIFGSRYFGRYRFDNEAKTITATQNFDKVSVTQELSLVNNTSTDKDDVAKFSYTYTNNDTVTHKVGLRIGFDTMLSENDDAPFRVPGTGDVTTHTEYKGSTIPQYWQAFDSLTDPTIVAQGSFTRDQASTPDMVRFCSYSCLSGDYWDEEFYPGNQNGDSSVLIFWQGRTLAPGQSITFSTYYGLSELAQTDESLMPPMALSMYGDKQAAQIDYDEETELPTYNEPVFTAYINNNGEETLEAAEVTIVLPDGITLADGYDQTVSFDSMNVGDINQADWKLVVDPTKVSANGEYQIQIIARTDNDVERTINSYIRIPTTLVQKTDISKATISTSSDPVIYTGSEVKPVVVTYGEGEEMDTLVEDSNYTIVYENNINVGKAKATITGIGMYEGTAEFEFDILPRNISDFAITTIDSAVYNGSPICPELTFGEGLSADDFTAEYANNVNAGTATVTLTHKSTNYTGTKVIPFTITPKSVENVTCSDIADTIYDGEPKHPEISVTDGDKILVPLTEDNADTADYYVEYCNNTDAGDTFVRINGINNYTDTQTKFFDILPKDISELTATLSPTSFTYSGNENKPAVTVKNGEKVLVQDTDYTVSYSDNIKAGTATATITGCGNYTGTQTLSFTVTGKAVSALTATLSQTSYTYSGKANKPAVTVKDGAKTLTAGTDYTVSYLNNVNAGTAAVRITGKGNYTGTKNLNFTISGKSAAGLTASLSTTSYTYSGNARKPTVTVKDGTKTLKKGTDYTVSYHNNTNAGKATAKITGKGNYAGTKSLSFTIKKRSVSSSLLKVTLSSTSYNYTGKERKPGVKIEFNYKTLVKGKDYVLKYSNCTNPGKATVTITGKGNFTGTKKINYTIKPAKVNVKNLSAVRSSSSSKKINVTWAKDNKVDGYQIAYSTSSNFSGQKTKTISGNSSTFTSLSGLKSNTKYYVRIRAYKMIDGNKVYGSYGSSKNVTTK